MTDIDIAREKRATEIYIKGLLQDFINSTGLPIADVEIETGINPVTNTREIRNVKTKLDVQAVSMAFC